MPQVDYGIRRVRSWIKRAGAFSMSPKLTNRLISPQVKCVGMNVEVWPEGARMTVHLERRPTWAITAAHKGADGLPDGVRFWKVHTSTDADLSGLPERLVRRLRQDRRWTLPLAERIRRLP